MPWSLHYLQASSRVSSLLRRKHNKNLVTKIVNSQATAFSSSSQCVRSQPDGNGHSYSTTDTSIPSRAQNKIGPDSRLQGPLRELRTMDELRSDTSPSVDSPLQWRAAAKDQYGRKSSDKITIWPADGKADDPAFQEASRYLRVDNASAQRTDDARLDISHAHETTIKSRKQSINKLALLASEEPNETQRLPWQVQKQALTKKFGGKGWNPRKRLSPDTLDGIRALHAQFPEEYPTSVLAERFKVSPEAIRRILKSRWKPNEAEQASRRLRWDKRGAMIWSDMVKLGINPPKKWREMGIRKKREPEKDGQFHRKRYSGRDMIEDRQVSSIEVVNSPTTSKRAEEVPRGLSLADRIL